MGVYTERLAILISADTRGAVRELNALERTSQRSLAATETASGGVGASLDRVGSRMLIFGAQAAAGGAVASAGLFQVAKGAAALEDAVQASNVIFGKDLSSSIDRFARNAADKLGMSRKEATETLTSFATFGRGAGLQGQGLLDFSESLSKIAVDLGSLKGVSTQEVVGAISSGLAGEIEPLRRLGIQITDVQKRAEAVRLGIRKANDTAPLTAQQNTLATASLIKTSPLGQAASGDFERTLDSLPNKLKVAQANIENLKASVGVGIVPVFASLADKAAAVARGFEALPEPLRNTIGSLGAIGAIGTTAAGALSFVGGGIAKLVSPVTSLASKTKDAGGGVSGLASVLLGGLNPAAIAATAAIGGGLAIFEAWSSAAEEAGQRADDLKTKILALKGEADTIPTIAAALGAAADGSNIGGALSAAGLEVGDFAKVVAAAPGQVDKFRDSVDGLFGAFETVGGGFGLSQVLQAVDFTSLDKVGELRDAAREAGPAVSGLINPLLDLVEAGKLTGDQFRDLINFTADYDKGAKGASDTYAQQASAIRAVAGDANITASALRDFNTATSDTASVQDKIAALDRLKAAFPDAVEAAGLAASAISDVGDAAATSATGLNAGASAVTGYAGKVVAAAASIKAAAETNGGSISNADLFSQATQTAQSAARSAIGYESALLRVQQAQERLNELNDPKKREQALASAVDRVTSAQDGLVDAMKRRRDAQEELDRLTRKSAVAGSVPLIQEIAKAADQGVADAKAKLDAAIAEFGAGSSQATAAQRLVDAASGRRDQSTGLLGQALAEQGGYNQREVRNARENVADADRGIMRAIKDKRDAEQEYGDALKEGSSTALERKSAELELATAALDAEVAYARLSGEIADGNQPFQDLADALGRARDAGIITGDQFDALAGHFGELETSARSTIGWVGELLNTLTTAAAQGLPLLEAFFGLKVPGVGGNPLGAPLGQSWFGFGPNGLPNGGTPAPASTTTTTAPRAASKPDWNPNTGGRPTPGMWVSVGYQTYQSAMDGSVWQWNGSTWVKAGSSSRATTPARPGGRIPFAEGGEVPGYGVGDTVPAMLTPGEYVLTRAATAAVGTDALKALNRGTARVEKYATGGLVGGARSVPTFPTGSSTAPRSSRSVEVSPTINITSTEPKKAADETIRSLRRATFLAGVR